VLYKTAKAKKQEWRSNDNDEEIADKKRVRLDFNSLMIFTVKSWVYG
jgi:hypothetical protein